MRHMRDEPASRQSYGGLIFHDPVNDGGDVSEFSGTGISFINKKGIT